MKKKEIINLGVTQYELFRLNYLEAVASGEQEAIHQMRVALKKFYALKKFLLHGMDPLGAAVVKNHLEPLRMVYRAAGKVRDVQVIRDVTINNAGLQAPEAFSGYLDSLQQSRLEKFLAISNTVNLPTQRDIAQSFDNYVKSYYQDKNSRLEHLIAKHLHEARFYLESTKPGDLWHEARTLIKQNFLLMQLAVVHHPQRFSAATIQEYRDMEQILGQWHDYTVLKKYALRCESTRALNINAYVQTIEQAIHNMEQTIQETFPRFAE